MFDNLKDLVYNFYFYALPVIIIICLLIILWFFIDIRRAKRIFLTKLTRDANYILENFTEDLEKGLEKFINSHKIISSKYSELSQRLEELENHNRTLSEIISRKNKQLDKLKRNRS